MKIKRLFFVALIISLITIGCKTAYEEVRTSNDPVKILAAANEYYDAEDFLKAQGLYELVIPFYRGKKEAEDLFYRYAYTHFNIGQYILSANYFNNFTKTFYNSSRKEEMAFMSAFSNYKMSPNHKLDQTPSLQAIEELQYFINTYPSSPRIEESTQLIDELRKKLEEKGFAQGKLYYDVKSYLAAITSFENMLKDFPETAKAEEVRYLILRSNEQLAKHSVYEKQKERLQSTIEACEFFHDKYEKSPYSNEVNGIRKHCKNALTRFD